MSMEQSVMRTMLLPGLFAAVRDNIDQLNDPPNLFELGRVYLWDDEVVTAPAHAAEPGAVLPHEPEALGIVLSGPLQSEDWTRVGRATDFYTLKGIGHAADAASEGHCAARRRRRHVPVPASRQRRGRPRCRARASWHAAPDVAATGIEDLELMARSTWSAWRVALPSGRSRTSAPIRRSRRTWVSSAATCRRLTWWRSRARRRQAHCDVRV
jgi:hypothetical protein